MNYLYICYLACKESIERLERYQKNSSLSNNIENRKKELSELEQNLESLRHEFYEEVKQQTWVAHGQPDDFEFNGEYVDPIV
jgi:predicted RNase H-like nuclease (RuvC/YqgF family)